MLEKWSEIGGEKLVKVIQPGNKDTFQQMNTVINELKPEYVLLDCYGYDADLPGEIQRKCGCIAYGPQQLAIERLKKIV